MPCAARAMVALRWSWCGRQDAAPTDYIHQNKDDFMNELNTIPGYKFENPAILRMALTHTSYANENREQGIQSNQRLEFLGDSVLSLIVSKYLYTKYPDLPEGELTRIRAGVVCEKALSECAQSIDLGRRLLLGKGEQQSGGRERASILSDAFESLIGAIYMDSGFDTARDWVLAHLKPMIGHTACGKGINDYKTALQEEVQKNPGSRIEYVIAEQTGPDHDRNYIIELYVDGKLFGKGKGKTKKEAEQSAAKEAVKRVMKDAKAR